MNKYALLFTLMPLVFVGCKKAETDSTKPTPGIRPKADFSIVHKHADSLPDTVQFSSSSTAFDSLTWKVDNVKKGTTPNLTHVFTTLGQHTVKLIAKNSVGRDSLTKLVETTIAKPVANFTIATSNQEFLPVTASLTNTSTGPYATFKWSFGNGSTSILKNASSSFIAGGIYNVKLVATNIAGRDSITKQIKISPYPQAYVTFNGLPLTLQAWEGSNKVMLLSRNATLNRSAMFAWLRAMESTYAYYRTCTGNDPVPNPPTFINGRTTIADVANTCGAGCGYLGATGIELQNTYFDVMYNGILANNQYDQAVFYEFGRNFWFYGGKLAYKANDPVTTGYAVFMRFMAIEAAGVNGGPFGSWTFATFKSNVEGLVDTYVANPSLNWSNTLGAGQGVPGSSLGATDLFASFCFRLKRDYGGQAFVQNVWKKVALRPAATTTQDAVDNFFLASCEAANRNLTALFQTWKFPLSASALAAASRFP